MRLYFAGKVWLAVTCRYGIYLPQSGDLKMAALGMLLTVGGGIASFVGSVAILIVAFKESVGQGFLNLIVPFYALYYLATRWEACKKGFLLIVGGSVVMVLGGIVAAMGSA